MLPLQRGDLFLGEAMSRASRHEAEFITGHRRVALGAKGSGRSPPTFDELGVRPKEHVGAGQNSKTYSQT